MTTTRSLTTLRHGIIAGLAGGLAEVGWVTLYAWATGGDPSVLARGVTTAAGVTALLPGSAEALGVAVHMTLAMVLGCALAFAWRTLSSAQSGLTHLYPVAIAALSGVWAVNFLIVLPIVSPEFTHLLPYAVSFTSKLLFGLAAAETLRRQEAEEPELSRAMGAMPLRRADR
jgi:hypothetical protein